LLIASVNENVAVPFVDHFAGVATKVGAGGALVFTVQEAVAAALMLPAASRATTRKVCVVLERFE
jgi:hypothetical protein